MLAGIQEGLSCVYQRYSTASVYICENKLLHFIKDFKINKITDLERICSVNKIYSFLQKNNIPSNPLPPREALNY